MARNRMIKPEFWTSLQLAECSTTARLLFVGTWTFADDAGIHPWSAKQLKMEIFPGDNFTESEVDGFLDELWAQGLISKFKAPDGRFFLQITGWHHQKIDKPTFKHPKPDDQFSTPIPRTLDEQSTTIRREVDDRSTQEEKLREGKEKLREETPKPPFAETDQPKQRPPSKAKGSLNVDELQVPDHLDCDEGRAAIREWVEYRAEIGKPLRSSRSLSAAFNRFATLERFTAAVRYSMSQGWQGLFESDGKARVDQSDDETLLRKLDDPNFGSILQGGRVVESRVVDRRPVNGHPKLPRLA